jgi:cation transporter-like permease
MTRVLFGAVIVAILGGVIGSLPSYRHTEINQSPSPRLDVSEPLRAISVLIGVGAGAIIGAIAGAVSALPGTRPLPRWFLQCLFVFSLIAMVIVLFLAWMYLGSNAARAPLGPNPVPIPDNQPGAPDQGR